MTTKEEVLLWAEGIELYRNGNYDGALDVFQNMGDYARIHFNTGMIYLRLQDFRNAVDATSRSTDADPYLAVSYFQRAYAWFMQEEYERAESDYTTALTLLRENDYIDYSQLGLKYRLYRCELHFNRAMCAHSINDAVSCTQDLNYAQRVMRSEEQKRIIDRAARMGVEAVTLFTVPSDAVFEVSDSKVRNAGGRQYLKDAKVVVDNSNTQNGPSWAGFDGALVVDSNNPSGPTMERKTGGTVVRRVDRSQSTDDMNNSMRPRANTLPNRNNTVGSSGSSGSSTGGGPERMVRAGSLPLRTGASQGPGSVAGSSFSRQRDDMSMDRSYNGYALNPSNASFSNTNGSFKRSEPTRLPLRADTSSPSQRSFPSSARSNNNTLNASMTRTQQRPYPSPTNSPSSPDLENYEQALRGRIKIKLHTVAPLPERNILMLVNPQDLAYKNFMSRVSEKCGSEGRLTLSYRDSDDTDQNAAGLISVLDEDDLSVAREVMGSRMEFWVSELRY